MMHRESPLIKIDSHFGTTHWLMHRYLAIAQVAASQIVLAKWAALAHALNRLTSSFDLDTP